MARPPAQVDIDQLAELYDAVDSGASVSFMQPFSVSAAQDWWRTRLERAVFYKRLPSQMAPR